MFPNRFKDNDKKPDYVLYISQDSESQSESQSESKVEVKPEVEEKKEIPDTLV